MAEVEGVLFNAIDFLTRHGEDKSREKLMENEHDNRERLMENTRESGFVEGVYSML